jgi:LysR family nitrogen assimilation transcriptional regulator
MALPIVNAFCTEYPQIAIRIREETSGDLRDLAARGEVDLVITNSHEPVQGLATDQLVTEPMLLVGPHGSVLSLDNITPIKRLAEFPLILTTKPNSLRRMVELKLGNQGLKPRLRVEANTLPLMTDLVAQGLGYTVLPASGVLSLIRTGQLSASPIAGLDITWTIARPSNRSLSLPARLMVDVIFRVVHDLVETGAWPSAEIMRDCRDAMRKRSRTVATRHN